MVLSGRSSAGKLPSGAHCGVKKVFFKNVTYETTPGFLLKKFRACGYVQSLDLWKLADGRSKGMGTVEFGSAAEAQQAVDSLSNVEIDGRPIVLELEDPAKHAGKGQEAKGQGHKGDGKGGDGPCRVFFKNVLFETSHGFLMGLFRKQGYVVDLQLWTHPDGRSKGMGTVDYRSPADARAAAAGLDGMEVDGRPMRVELADATRGTAGEDARGKGGDSKGKGGSKGMHGPCRVFFKNVLFETTPGFLMGLFRKQGYVVDFQLWTHPDGRSRGMGTVDYRSAADASAAVAGLDGVEVDGRPMRVDFEDATRGMPGEATRGRGDDSKGKGGGKHVQGPCRLFFRNVLFETTAGYLLALFKKHGYVVELELRKTPDGRSKGKGTVEYAHHWEASNAVMALDGFDVDGRPLIVEFEDQERSLGTGGEKGRGSKGDGKQWRDSGKGAWGPSKVFFKNLLYETPQGFMLDLFKKYGFVQELNLWRTPEGRSKGMGTVEFRHPAEARRAVDELNGAEVDGRVILVEFDDPHRTATDGKGASPHAGGKGAMDGPCKVFFKNVLFETPHDFLRDLFRKYGQVVDFRLWTGPEGRSKGMGTAEYRSPAEARSAMVALDGAEVDGRRMTVELEDPSRTAAEAKGAPIGGGKGGAGPCRVFFRNVLFETTPGFLMGKFRQCGHVVQLDMWTTPDGRSKGKGTVDYSHPAEAREAAARLNGVSVDGRPISVELEDLERHLGAAVAVYAPAWAKGKGHGKRASPY